MLALRQGASGRSITVDACWGLSRALIPDRYASAVMAGSARAKEEPRCKRNPNGRTATCGRAVTEDVVMPGTLKY